MHKFIRISCINILILGYNCLLEVSKHSKEGGEGELVSSYPRGSLEITWYNPGQENITTCYLYTPIHCKIPTNPNYIISVKNGSSTLIVEKARYKQHDGVWTCVYRSEQSYKNDSIKFIVASLPKAFMFIDAPKLGFNVDGHAVHLVATAKCVYPQASLQNVELHYRLQDKDTFQQFTKRKLHISTSHNPNCDQREYDLKVETDILMTDFNQTSVIFQYIYTSVSRDISRTADVVFLKFGASLPNCTQPCQSNSTCNTTQSPKDVCRCPFKNGEFFCQNIAKRDVQQNTTVKPYGSKTIESTGLEQWEIVLIAVSVIIALAILLTTVTFCYRRTCAKKNEDETEIVYQEQKTPRVRIGGHFENPNYSDS